jgi:hypothetical protein
MSGLLDKATAAKDAKPAKSEKVDSSPASPQESSPVTSEQTFFQQASNIGLALGAMGFLGMWFLDNYWLEDITGPIPFGLVALALLGGSFYLVWDSVDREKTIVLAVAYLLMTSVPYLAGLELGQDSIGIAELQIDEDSNEFTFVVRGSFSEATSTIEVDGETVWSDTQSLSADMVRFKAPLSEVFQGNSQNNRLAIVLSYTLSVESNTGTVETVEITPSLLNREVTHSGARITLVTETSTDDGSTTTSEAGLQIESILGMFGDTETPINNGDHSMSNIDNYLPISSDYTIQLKVMKDSSQKWQSPVISVDGTSAEWVSEVSGSQVGFSDRWLAIPGTGYDPNTGVVEILEREDFFDDDGCYTFQVIVTNEYYGGSTAVHMSSSSWELNWENPGANDNMPTC